MFAPLEDVSNYEITFVSIAFPQGAQSPVCKHSLHQYIFYSFLSLKEITIFEEKGVRRIYWTRVRSFCLPFLLTD